MRPRVIFMGSPEFSVPALQRLARSERCELALVVTQPDRRAGRGMKVTTPPVKAAADALGLPVLQTSTLRDPGVRDRIASVRPDLIVVAAFGMILRNWILNLPARGCVNLHASLLPKYRGANPIASAILAGDSVTGVTLMRMDEGLDTGDIYATSVVDIANTDTTESLTARLADIAATLLERHLDGLLDGSLIPRPQPDGVTLTRPMTKDDGWMDFTLSADHLERHTRAMWPWPRSWTTSTDGHRVQVHAVDVRNGKSIGAGVVSHYGKEVVVGAGDGLLVLRRIQLPGGKPVAGSAILRSSLLADGTILGTDDKPRSNKPLFWPVQGHV